MGPMQEAARESQAGVGGLCRRTGTGSQGPATCLSRWSVSAASEAWMLRKQGAPGDAGQSGLGLALPSLQTTGQDHLPPQAMGAHPWPRDADSTTSSLLNSPSSLSRVRSRRNPPRKTRCLFLPVVIQLFPVEHLIADRQRDYSVSRAGRTPAFMEINSWGSLERKQWAKKIL